MVSLVVPLGLAVGREGVGAVRPERLNNAASGEKTSSGCCRRGRGSDIGHRGADQADVGVGHAVRRDLQRARTGRTERDVH